MKDRSSQLKMNLRNDDEKQFKTGKIRKGSKERNVAEDQKRSGGKKTQIIGQPP